MRQAQYNPSGLADLAKQIRKRLRNNYDCIGAVTGYEGTGKSNIAIQLAMMVDPKFKVDRNIVLGTDFTKIKDTIVNLPQYSAIVYDEGVKQWYKGDWSSKVQRSLVKYSTVFRKENKLHLICIPHFEDLTRAFRQRRVFFWIHVLERGVAILFKSLDKSPMVAWYIDDLDKLFKKSVEMRKMNIWSVDDNMAIMSKSVHYFYTFPFPRMTEELEKEYLAYVKIHALEGLDAEPDMLPSEQYQDAYLKIGHLVELIKRGEIRGKMTATAVAKLVGLNDRRLQRWVRQWKDTSKPSREDNVNKT